MTTLCMTKKERAATILDTANYPLADYRQFLTTKRIVSAPAGFDVEATGLCPALFGFQRDIVLWALRRGRAAIFADCGLGKTLMQLSWAQEVEKHTGCPVLILAPLAVGKQSARIGQSFGFDVRLCQSQEDVKPGINVTNYERLHLFDTLAFDGIVLDESSILKSFDGKTRRDLTAFADGTPYRLACTATPAPNDLVELTNHAEFLEIMSAKEIIALFFTQDGNTTHAWRLKGHAREDFWRWVASWAVVLRQPSDLGYPDDGFVLPPLVMHQITVAVHEDAASNGRLFPVEAITLQERQSARRDSIGDRVRTCAEMINGSDKPWIVWCNLNAESAALAALIPDAVEVAGSHSPEHKESAMMDFAEGRVRVLVTKPSIAGFGMNWQHCNKVAFVGLSDSYEQFYQSVRRCWRFGQMNPVDCYMITAQTEGAVVKNIQRKEQGAREMMENIVRHTAGLSLGRADRDEMEYAEGVASGRDWRLYLGDSVMAIDNVETESVGLSVFSPPFPGMYAYTNSSHDMGNTKNHAEMMNHFRFLVGREKMLRVTKPGRKCCIHLTQIPAFKGTDGYVGLKDFRGDVIRLMEEEGWIYYGEVTIDKDPQVKAQRTKDASLQFKSLATDSSRMRMALADYLIYFNKPGDNAVPIRAGISAKYDNPNGWLTNEEWIEWAAPVWYRARPDYPGGIRETDVLNVACAREGDDERHLCPLQLGVIERAVKLWSNPGDLVLDPFNGIGSTGCVSLKLGRQYVGCELKQSYFQTAVKNLRLAETQANAGNLFSLLEGVEAAANEADVKAAIAKNEDVAGEKTGGVAAWQM